MKKLMGKKEPTAAPTMEQLNNAMAKKAGRNLNRNLLSGNANASRPELMEMIKTAVRTGSIPKNFTPSKYTLYIYSNVTPVGNLNLTNSSGFNRHSEPLTITKITPPSILNNQLEIVGPFSNKTGKPQTLVRLKTNVNVYYKIPETHLLSNKYESVLVTLNLRDGIYGVTQDNGSMVLMVWVYVDLQVLDGNSVLKWDPMSNTIQRVYTTYLIPKGGGASSKVDLRNAMLRNISNNSKKSVAEYEEVERRRTGSTILPNDPGQEEFSNYVGIRNEELEE